MPKATVAVLSYSSLAAFVGYLALIATTVFFASVENSLSLEAREAESRIALLETEYYDAIEDLSATDLGSAGLTDPSRVTYVSEDGAPAVTRADR